MRPFRIELSGAKIADIELHRDLGRHAYVRFDVFPTYQGTDRKEITVIKWMHDGMAMFRDVAPDVMAVLFAAFRHATEATLMVRFDPQGMPKVAIHEVRIDGRQMPTEPCTSLR